MILTTFASFETDFATDDKEEKSKLGMITILKVIAMVFFSIAASRQYSGMFSAMC